MDDSWVPVECPDNLEEMFEAWSACKENNVGWCLLCNSAIRTAEDLLPGTSTHNCDAGRELEEKIRKVAQQSTDIDVSLGEPSATVRGVSYIDGICTGGFSDPVTIDQLRSTRCDGIPAEPGIYVITFASVDEPRFLKESTGGWFKGKNPSYSPDVVERNWVKGTSVVYVGMTRARKGLRGRICQLLDFGSGKRVGHRGGRLLWHLQDSGQLLVRWRTCAASETDWAESAVISCFKAIHDDKRPYANMLK